MSTNRTTARASLRIVPDVRLGLESLLTHKLRSILTMLGMIFGVAAVVSMLSIGAGAQQQVMAFIEGLGVRNLIIEAREASDDQAYQAMRAKSPGLTFRDLRIIRANVSGIDRASPRKRIVPAKLLPRPEGVTPVVYGVAPEYGEITNMKMVEGRFFEMDEHEHALSVCVLGDGVKSSLFAGRQAIGEYVKINEQWFRVIGVAAPQLTTDTEVVDVPTQDRNQVIYVPLGSALLRLEESRSYLKDEIDGAYLRLDEDANMTATARTIRGLLDDTHSAAGDYSVIVPAELLAQQQRARRVFEMVMVAIASISLLVGGIGIMNIMLASVLERTREIGVRRAVGARRREIVRQFLIEASLISSAGGVAGVLVGIAIAQLIAYFAGWTTIVTSSSILLALLVSVTVGLIFGVYPAIKASRLDPVVALHYE